MLKTIRNTTGSLRRFRDVRYGKKGSGLNHYPKVKITYQRQAKSSGLYAFFFFKKL
jgi:hypothetical protein